MCLVELNYPYNKFDQAVSRIHFKQIKVVWVNSRVLSWMVILYCGINPWRNNKRSNHWRDKIDWDEKRTLFTRNLRHELRNYLAPSRLSFIGIQLDFWLVKVSVEENFRPFLQQTNGKWQQAIVLRRNSPPKGPSSIQSEGLRSPSLGKRGASSVTCRPGQSFRACWGSRYNLRLR